MIDSLFKASFNGKFVLVMSIMTGGMSGLCGGEGRWGGSYSVLATRVITTTGLCVRSAWSEIMHISLGISCKF